MLRIRLRTLLVALLSLHHLGATITVDSFWQIGGGDSGASNGSAISSLNDSVGGNHLSNLIGSPTYTANTINPGFSSLAASFSSGQAAYSNSVASLLTDNFGYEGFFKIGAGTPNGTNILHNGYGSGTDGWGFFIDGSGNMVGHYAGVDFVGSSAVSYNNWIHYAVVRDSGISTLYVNGAASGATTANAPLTPTGRLSIGGPISGPNLTGDVDEFRVFHFTAGQFQASDLLYFSAIPEPNASFLLLLLLPFLLKWSLRRKTLAL